MHHSKNILISFVLVGFEAVILKVALNSICIFSFATNELPTFEILASVV
jgi:uncharacterized membrane protein